MASGDTVRTLEGCTDVSHLDRRKEGTEMNQASSDDAQPLAQTSNRFIDLTQNRIALLLYQIDSSNIEISFLKRALEVTGFLVIVRSWSTFDSLENDIMLLRTKYSSRCSLLFLSVVSKDASKGHTRQDGSFGTLYDIVNLVAGYLDDNIPMVSLLTTSQQILARHPEDIEVMMKRKHTVVMVSTLFVYYLWGDFFTLSLARKFLESNGSTSLYQMYVESLCFERHGQRPRWISTSDIPIIFPMSSYFTPPNPSGEMIDE